MLKKRLKNNHLLFLMIFFLFLLTACGTKDYTLNFKKEMVLDYKSGDSPLILIDTIGDKEVSKKMIKNNKIEIDNFSVECKNIPTDKTGSYEVKYVTNDTENRFYTKTIIVKDISAPIIKLKSKSISLTLQEYKNFDFSTLIKITDNWDKDEPIVDLSVEEIKATGQYTIKISAEDKAGNKSKENLSLIIKDEDKKPSSDENKENNENSDIKPPAPIEKPNYPSDKPASQLPIMPPSQPPKPKPSNQEFLFSDGYTMENVGSACFTALQGSGYSGSCNPIKDANGIYIGMRLTFN